MTLPNNTAISFGQVNSELGRSATQALSLNDGAVRNLAGVASGAIAMSQLWGKSNAASFNLADGSYTYLDYGSFTLTCNQNVAWTWSVSGTTAGATGSPASGGAATSLRITAPNAAVNAVRRTATFAISAAGHSWSIAMSTSGSEQQCVAIDSYLPNGKQAYAAAVNDDMLLLNRTDDDGYHVEPIQAVTFAERPCVRIVTKSGITLVASIETPITTRNGVVVPITESEGYDVPVLDKGEFRWEPIVRVDPAGLHIVAKINVNDGTYAASETNDGRYVFTHNIKQ